MKKYIKKIVPKSLIKFYHKAKSYFWSCYFGLPSKKMIMIGITGTKGKTSTANFIWSVLSASPDFKVGLIGTANIRIGEEEFMNSYHMTMPDTRIIQRELNKMYKKGCTHAVMEVTSEGIKQMRHLSIDFDIGVFTNLTPEHLPSHGGSFDLYKKEKGKFFKTLENKPKQISGKIIEKTIIVNTDSEHGEYFLSFAVPQKVTYGMNAGELRATHSIETKTGSTFVVGDAHFGLSILGLFNIYNALPAIAIARLQGLSDKIIDKGLRSLKLIPGRVEIIESNKPFLVVVDYAHEKVSMNLLLDMARNIVGNSGRIIVLLGAEGGGRDKSKRLHMGQAVGNKADVVIVSNVDPYDDDPMEIAESIAVHVRESGKEDGKNLFIILDRREGITHALHEAKENDIVLITGKGSEQSMIIGGKQIPWDDRIIVRDILNNI